LEKPNQELIAEGFIAVSTFEEANEQAAPKEAALPEEKILTPEDAEGILLGLAGVQSRAAPPFRIAHHFLETLDGHSPAEGQPPNVEAKYRALVEQLPAVIFMAYLDRGIGEAYVSPQIESALGFSQKEWLEDPVLWYQQIHPEDKSRWSVEAAEMFLTGEPLRSAYRVLARDGHVIWFHCEAKMIRRPDGTPWFLHGIAFDITELKHTEAALEQERSMVSAILDTVGALVIVLDRDGRVIRFNRACEQMTGRSVEQARNLSVWDLFLVPEEKSQFTALLQRVFENQSRTEYESSCVDRNGSRRTISWSAAILPEAKQTPTYVIASGIDISERKRLEKTVLEISEREQRRIGQDLHDGLGQHLTGIAFMTKVQEQRLAERKIPEAEDATRIVQLVNDAILKTRELSRGLLPVVSEARGLMSALRLFAEEISDLFAVNCCFECEQAVLIHDDATATHLYRIAQEAVNNAIKHGHAANISIRLGRGETEGTLAVRDDGAGIDRTPAPHAGVGLHIMNYRAGMIGGTLDIRREQPRGTSVTCRFPVPTRTES
jgi:PAS domain S-box-containing protein